MDNVQRIGRNSLHLCLCHNFDRFMERKMAQTKTRICGRIEPGTRKGFESRPKIQQASYKLDSS